MKNGNIVRVTIHYYNHKETCLAILAAQDENCTVFILENGQEQRIQNSKIEKISYVRGISEEARKLCKERFELYKAYMENYKKIRRLQEDNMSLKNKMISFSSDLSKAMGKLPIREFVEELERNLPSNIQKYLYDFDYKIDYMEYAGKININFTRTVYLKKYCRSATFLYQEYDGTMQFIHEYEKDSNYQQLVKANERKIPFKNMEFISELGLGDKDWLSYTGCYHLDIPKGSLTKEFAKKLAKKICT